MTHWLTIAFIAGALAHLAVQFWLSLRQSGHVAAHRDRVPTAFAGTVSAEEHAKAADYTVARQRFGRVEILFDTVLLFVMTLGGGIAAAWAVRCPPCRWPVRTGWHDPCTARPAGRQRSVAALFHLAHVRPREQVRLQPDHARAFRRRSAQVHCSGGSAGRGDRCAGAVGNERYAGRTGGWSRGPSG